MSQIPRLYIGAQPLSQHSSLTCDEKQSHYLIRVLRLSEGSQVKLLGSSGEWLAEITHADKKHTSVQVKKQLRSYQEPGDIWLCFAPVKNEKIDFLARRAVELGARKLWPVKTEYTQNARINAERLAANMVESAEQCSRMDVPELGEYITLHQLLEGWDASRTMFYADESGGGEPLHEAAKALKKGGKAAILIGPEGGFSPAERAMLKQLDVVKPITLGPRILRAETAALVGLAHLQAWLGDGDKTPHFVVEQKDEYDNT